MAGHVSAAIAPRHSLGGYREYDPPASLARHGEAVWLYRTPARRGRAEGATHRVLPDPAINIVFSCHRGADGRARDPRLIIIGAVVTPRVVSFPPGFEMAAVRLKREWAPALLGVVPGDHDDATDDQLGDVAPLFSTPLLDMLAESRTGDAALTMLAAALARQARREPAHPPEVAATALDLVRRAAGRLPVERVAAAMGISVRYLRRVVRRDAGVSLKEYARTVRFLHAVTAADRTPDPTWARIAAESGFCDQSHLVRESRALCGLPPGRVFRERRAEAETSNRA